jgi:hypothetical protein
MPFWDKLFVTKGPSNPKLDKAMATLAEGGENSELRRQMYLALLNSTLILSPPQRPGELPGEEGGVTHEANLSLQFHTTPNARGKPAMLAFTSMDSLLLWRKGIGDYFALSAREVFALALKSDMDSIQLNVAGPTGSELTKAEIQVLSEGGISEYVPDASAPGMDIAPGTQVQLKVPSKEPSKKLLETLRQNLTMHPEVHSAYLVEMTVGSGSAHLAVGLVVEGDTAKAQEIFQAVGEETSPLLDKADWVDFALLERGPMTDEFRKVVRPFYKR